MSVTESNAVDWLELPYGARFKWVEGGLGRYPHVEIHVRDRETNTLAVNSMMLPNALGLARQILAAIGRIEEKRIMYATARRPDERWDRFPPSASKKEGEQP